MERAKAKAKEFGKNLLLKAMGASDSSGEENESHHGGSKAELHHGGRPSWRDVVVGSPVNYQKMGADRKAGMPQVAGTHFREGRGEAGMPRSSSTDPKTAERKSPSRSPPKIFSAEDVAKLVELARAQLRKEKSLSSGWEEVQSKETKRKEKAYA